MVYIYIPFKGATIVLNQHALLLQRKDIMNKKNRGFTLIELLVVITIIAILAGLAFPAFSGVLKMVARTRASAMIESLTLGLKQYESEYGRWPDAFTDEAPLTGKAYEDLYETLVAKKTGSNYPADNPRGIVFVEFQLKDLQDSSGSVPPNSTTAVKVVDPWGNDYQVAVDFNYDNVIDDLPDPKTGTTGSMNRSVAVWSTGDDPANPKRTIVGW